MTNWSRVKWSSFRLARPNVAGTAIPLGLGLKTLQGRALSFDPVPNARHWVNCRVVRPTGDAYGGPKSPKRVQIGKALLQLGWFGYARRLDSRVLPSRPGAEVRSEGHDSGIGDRSP